MFNCIHHCTTADKSSAKGLDIIQAVPNKDNGSQTKEVMNCDDDDNEPTIEQLAYVANMIRCLKKVGRKTLHLWEQYVDIV